MKPGERILCFVPESGRFTVGYVLFEVVGPATDADAAAPAPEPRSRRRPRRTIRTPRQDPLMRTLLRELAGVWHDYRSRAWRAPIVSRVTRGDVTHADLVRWME